MLFFAFTICRAQRYKRYFRHLRALKTIYNIFYAVGKTVEKSTNTRRMNHVGHVLRIVLYI